MTPDEANAVDQKLIFLRTQPAGRFTVEELALLLSPFPTGGDGVYVPERIEMIEKMYDALTGRLPAAEAEDFEFASLADYY